MSRDGWVPGIETCRPSEQDAVVAVLRRRGCHITGITSDNDGYYEYVDPDRSSRREWISDPRLYIAYECPPPTSAQLQEAAAQARRKRDERVRHEAEAERLRISLQRETERRRHQARERWSRRVKLCLGLLATFILIFAISAFATDQAQSGTLLRHMFGAVMFAALGLALVVIVVLAALIDKRPAK